jgi:hypothetical protein
MTRNFTSLVPVDWILHNLTRIASIDNVELFVEDILRDQPENMHVLDARSKLGHMFTCKDGRILFSSRE